MPWETPGWSSESDSSATLTVACTRCRSCASGTGVSRKTGNQWAARYARGGLRDRSRAPKSCLWQTPQEVCAKLLETRGSHPTWGPRKLLAWLRKRQPEVSWPAPSTVGGILKRYGLVETRGRTRKPWPSTGRGSIQAKSPNDVWTGDFKGQFRTGDGRLCYPLTIADWYSRFLLGGRGIGHGFGVAGLARL
jgi:putative transposase